GAVVQAVVARQAVCNHAEVGCALNVVVAAENVGAAAGHPDVAKRKLQGAVGAGVVVAVGMLGAAHAPDQGSRPVVGERAGDAPQLRTWNAGDALGLFRRPLGDLCANLVHAPDALADVLLVLPAVLEDVP